MVVSFNEFMLEPIQVVCPACVPNSFVECPKCREVVHLLIEDDPVVVAH